MFGERCSSQASATWHAAWRQPGRDRVERLGLQRGEAAEREEGTKAMPSRGAAVDQVVVVAVGEVVEVLHADDRRDGLRLGELLGGDVADARGAGSGPAAAARPAR